MTKKQYAKMDWEAIESIVYSDNAHPFDILTPQKSGKDTLIQAFLPFAESAEVVFEGKDEAIPMEMVDEEGFYAVFVPGTGKKLYCYRISTKDGETVTIKNPYDFAPVIPKDGFEDFIAGNCTDAYRILGAHTMTLEGVAGVNFAVWAPNALRVSVIGEWNRWDGRVNPMQKLDEYGVFTLFIPDVKAGDAYRFELKVKGNEILLKDDPYATLLNESGYAVVNESSAFEWSDKTFVKNEGKKLMGQPVQICQVSLQDIVAEASKGKKKLVTVLRETVAKLGALGCTHVELAPVMAESSSKKDAYQTLFYYATTNALKENDVIKEFVNECHKAGISVLMDWSVAYYAKDSNGLEFFDGSHLYEHADVRQGYQPVYDANVFRYQCPEVKSFLISNAYFWMKKYHFDGICFNDLASVLYLDYGRNEWVPNAYGGKENLEFVDFIKEINNKIKADFPGSITVADIDAVWADASDKNKNSLGFDFVWNNGFKKDFVGFVKSEPYARAGKLLTMLSGLDYAYNENYVLPLSADVIENGMLKDFPGILEENYAALRAAYAYTMLYPGKKIFCPDFKAFVDNGGKKAKRSEFAVAFDAFMAEMSKLYKDEKLLYGFDEKAGSLEWVNHKADVSNVITFVRKSNKKNEILYVVANFSNTEYEELKLVAPFAGKYTELLSTDDSKFGGKGICNPKTVATEEAPYDETVNTLTVKAAPMSVSVYAYKPFTAKELADIAEHKRQLRIAYVKAERAKIEKRRDEIIAEAIKDAENRIKELEKILEEK
ncbi:MAG: alpha amylase C-terminal domain-containing protein [Lachnospiraceae bacterium]|nr:alpha amylase C-terminal domain-containing protein [Lachnospiraceae bacterium]